MQEITVTQNEAGQRLDKLLGKFLNQAPRGFLYKMLRKKNITLNDHSASGSERLKTGDIVKLFLAEETIHKFSAMPKRLPKAETLDIIYEDAQILLINKPVGMLSQKAKETDISAVEILTRYLLDSGQLTREELRTFRPSVCNRLDRNTSGILAAGKTLAALQELNRMFKERTIGKYYLCLVVGTIEKENHIHAYLRKDEKTNQVQIFSRAVPGGARVETEYLPLCSREDVTLLKVHLITGKTHQIRAHLAQAGHPLIGDYKYGNHAVNERFRSRYGLTSQLLHAWQIILPETDGVLSPLSGKTFTADLPLLFRQIAQEKGVLPWLPGIPGDYAGRH